MPTYRFEDCELNTATAELRRGGELVAVEPQVFAVLVYLIEHRERMVTKEELLDEVWGNRFVSESALTTRIKEVRRGVGDDGRNQRIVSTIHGRGYRFVADTTVDGTTEAGAGEPIEPIARIDLSVDREFPFVGRGDTLARLEEMASHARQGPVAMLIGGEPGIGKSRLATEFAGRLADTSGFTALGGRCERHLATSLQPWLEALGSYVHTQPAGQLAADTAGIADHLRTAFPTLDARLGAETGSSARRAPDDYATIDAIAVLMERMSRRSPVVVVLDDVQWAGGATRSLVSLLLRRRVARVLLVLTFRTTSDDLDDASRDWLASLEATDAVERVDLGSLSEAEVESLVLEVLGAEGALELGHQVWEMSGGHSLFAVELLRDLRAGVAAGQLPRSVASLVRTRVAKLPRSVVSLVSGGAAVGSTFDLTVAARAVDLSEFEALEAVDHALGAQILHEVEGAPDRFRFSHQLVPAAILDSMSSARRVRLHARIVEVLEELDAAPVEVAHHLLEAAPILDADMVIGQVRRTAMAARTDVQFDRAADLLDRCLALPMDDRTKAEVSIELGQAYNLAALQPRALAPFGRAAKLARAHGWSDLLAAAALGMWGQSPFRASQDRTVVPLLDEAIARRDDLDQATYARLLAKRSAFKLFTAPLEERDESTAAALDLVGPATTWSRLEVLEARWMAIASPAMVPEVTRIDEELRVLRKELGALTNDACAPEISIYWNGDGGRLREVADELRADPRARRDIDQWRTTALAAMFAVFDSDFDAARRLNDRALPLGREPWGESGQVVHALLALILDVLEGVPGRSLARWEQVATDVPSESMRATRAWVEAVSGDAATANDLVDATADGLVRMSQNFMGGFGLVGFSEAVLALGRTELIPKLRGVLDPLADRMLGHPWAVSFAAADVLSRLDAAVGDADASARHQDQALALYDRLGATSLRARLEQA